MKQYDVILADPPWPYTFSNTRNGKTPDDYPRMTMQDIADLEIKSMAAKNCALFLWVNWPTFPDALSIIPAWGFSYRTLAWVWIKAKPTGFGFHFGMGNYTRSNSEPCLLAVKGVMPVAVHDIQSLIYSAVLEHSRKPDDQYRKIEALYPGMNYLELFARRERAGWDSLGNGIDGKDIRESLQAQPTPPATAPAAVASPPIASAPGYS